MAQVIVYENGNAIGGEGHPTYARDITFENEGTDLVSEQTNDAIVEVNGKKAEASDLTSISESGTTASQAISAGKFFYLNGTLVRAKTAIASGATFTLNTNYEVVTAGALNELNSALTMKQLKVSDGVTISANSATTVSNNNLVGKILVGYALYSVASYNLAVTQCMIDQDGRLTLTIKNNGNAQITTGQIYIYYIG